MSEIVFVLGAGASFDAGAPLMADFLDRAEDLVTKKAAGESKEHFERVFEAIHALQAVDYKSSLDLDNLEAVFAAFEMAFLVKKLANWPPQKIERLLVSTRHMICTTLAQTVRFPVTGNGMVVAPTPYRRFASLVEELNGGGRTARCAIITFNYDLALDYAFAGESGKPSLVDYGLMKPETDSARIPLLKLHGSLNWLEGEDGSVIPVRLFKYGQRSTALAERGYALFRLSRSRPFVWPERLAHAVNDPVAVIVPPTWNKSQYARKLGTVWARAAKELEDAKMVFVCGFSLPSTDSFFNYLFALGTVSRTRIRHFWVMDPDPAVEGRFRSLIGPHVERSFEYFPDKFKDAIARMRTELLPPVGPRILIA